MDIKPNHPHQPNEDNSPPDITHSVHKPQSKQEWYRKSWGIVVAILILPFFAIWYAWAKSNWSKNVKIGVTAAASIFIIVALIVNSGNKTEPKTVSQPVASQTTAQQPQPKTQPVKATPAKPASTIDQLWTAADTSLKSRDKINVDYDKTEKVAFLEHTDEEPYSAGSFVKQTYSMLVLWGQEAFKVKGVDIINVQNKTKFTDQYGNDKVQTGVTIEMTKEQFNQFNWKNLDHLPVHDRIKANSNIYIIVPALLSQIKDPSNDLYLRFSYP